jgi:hypothetical protein
VGRSLKANQAGNYTKPRNAAARDLISRVTFGPTTRFLRFGWLFENIEEAFASEFE